MILISTLFFFLKVGGFSHMRQTFSLNPNQNPNLLLPLTPIHPMLNEDKIKPAKETAEKEEPSRFTDTDARPEVSRMDDQGACCPAGEGPDDPRESSTAVSMAQTAAFTEAETMRPPEEQRQPDAHNQEVSAEEKDDRVRNETGRPIAPMRNKSSKLRAKAALIPETPPSKRRTERFNLPRTPEMKTPKTYSPSPLTPETTKAIKATLVDDITRNDLHTWAIEGRNLESLRRILEDATVEIDLKMEGDSRDVERWISGKIIEWLEEGEREEKWEVQTLEILTPRTKKGRVDGGGGGGESPELGEPLSPREAESKGDDSDGTTVEEGTIAPTPLIRRAENSEFNSDTRQPSELIFEPNRPSNALTVRPQSQLQAAIPPPANARPRDQSLPLGRMISAEEFTFLEGILFRLVFTNPRVTQGARVEVRAAELLRMAGRRVLLSLAPSPGEQRRCDGRLGAVGLGEREVTRYYTRLYEELTAGLDDSDEEESEESEKAEEEGAGEERDTEDDSKGETTAGSDDTGEGVERRNLSRRPPSPPALGESSRRARPYPADDGLIPTAPSPPRYMRMRMALEETARTPERRGQRQCQHQRQRQRQDSMERSEAMQVGYRGMYEGFSIVRLGLRGGGSEDDIPMPNDNDGDAQRSTDDQDVLGLSEDPDKTTGSEQQIPDAGSQERITPPAVAVEPPTPHTIKEEEAPESGDQHGEERGGDAGGGGAGDGDNAHKNNRSLSEQENRDQNEDDEDDEDDFHDSKEYFSDDEDSQDNDALTAQEAAVDEAIAHADRENERRAKEASAKTNEAKPQTIREEWFEKLCDQHQAEVMKVKEKKDNGPKDDGQEDGGKDNNEKNNDETDNEDGFDTAERGRCLRERGRGTGRGERGSGRGRGGGQDGRVTWRPDLQSGDDDSSNVESAIQDFQLTAAQLEARDLVEAIQKSRSTAEAENLKREEEALVNSLKEKRRRHMERDNNERETSGTKQNDGETEMVKVTFTGIVIGDVDNPLDPSPPEAPDVDEDIASTANEDGLLPPALEPSTSAPTLLVTDGDGMSPREKARTNEEYRLTKTRAYKEAVIDETIFAGMDPEARMRVEHFLRCEAARAAELKENQDVPYWKAQEIAEKRAYDIESEEARAAAEKEDQEAASLQRIERDVRSGYAENWQCGNSGGGLKRYEKEMAHEDQNQEGDGFETVRRTTQQSEQEPESEITPSSDSAPTIDATSAERVLKAFRTPCKNLCARSPLVEYSESGEEKKLEWRLEKGEMVDTEDNTGMKSLFPFVATGAMDLDSLRKLSRSPFTATDYEQGGKTQEQQDEEAERAPTPPDAGVLQPPPETPDRPVLVGSESVEPVTTQQQQGSGPISSELITEIISLPYRRRPRQLEFGLKATDTSAATGADALADVDVNANANTTDPVNGNSNNTNVKAQDEAGIQNKSSPKPQKQITTPTKGIPTKSTPMKCTLTKSGRKYFGSLLSCSSHDRSSHQSPLIASIPRTDEYCRH
jgi:hypothetical protein